MDETSISESELEEWMTRYGSEFERCNCGSEYIQLPPGFVYKAKLDEDGKVVAVSKIDMTNYSMFASTPYCAECSEEIG